MARATWVLATTTAIGFVMSVYLLRQDHRCPAGSTPGSPPAPMPTFATPQRSTPCGDLDALLERARLPPPGVDTESSLESRARLTDAMTMLLGRQPHETDDEYRGRLSSMVQLALAGPRARAAEMRREAEAKAHVTPEQSAKLDEAFTKVYAGMLASTNKAIADGKLSPYERNVAGWLQLAGEVGSELDGANATIATILDPPQARAMYEAGFDWSEYLGLEAPWENFAVLPAPPSK